jgi:hypothetical protein
MFGKFPLQILVYVGQAPMTLYKTVDPANRDGKDANIEPRVPVREEGYGFYEPHL